MLCQGFQCLTSGIFQKWVLYLVCTKTPKAGVGSQLVQKLEVWYCLLLPPVVLGDHGRGDPWQKRPSSAPALCEWLHWTHCRTQLSPSAKLVVPLGKRAQERAENTGQAEQEGKKWETTGFKNKAGGEGAPGTTAQGETMPEQTSLERTVANGKPCQIREKMSGGGSSI